MTRPVSELWAHGDPWVLDLLLVALDRDTYAATEMVHERTDDDPQLLGELIGVLAMMVLTAMGDAGDADPDSRDAVRAELREMAVLHALSGIAEAQLRGDG